MLKLFTLNRDTLRISNTATKYDGPRLLDVSGFEDRDSISPRTAARALSSHGSTGSKPISSYTNNADLHYVSNLGPPLDTPTLIRTPWEYDRSKRGVDARQRKSAQSRFSQRFFEQLPKEVYDCILVQLRKIHLESNHRTRLSCLQQDLYNLTMTSRTWDRTTRRHLYGEIWLSEEDLTQQLAHKKSKLPGRIKLLRRTLCERPQLAKLVKVLHVHGTQLMEYPNSDRHQEELVNLAASLVMACPNLEALRGFYPTVDHHFNRLNQALSKKQNLKERVFFLSDENSRLTQTRRSEESRILFYQYENPTEMFLEQSDRWSQLSTLFLHGQRPGSMNFRSFVATFRKLASLQNLVISSFHSNDFNDRTILALPSVRSLRLQNLPGLTDKGVLRFANSATASSIQNLALVDLELTYLHTIRYFFKNLQDLRRFTFHQNSAPCLMPGATLPRPLFASQTLEYLHWDVLISGRINSELAISISTGSFPSLRTIRSPSDHDGRFQDLCKPLAQATIPSDFSLISRVDSPFEDAMHYERNLPAARRAAQGRIESARKQPALRVIIEEEGMIKSVHTMRAFMGAVGSKIEYSLEPDVKGSDDALLSIKDLVNGHANLKQFF